MKRKILGERIVKAIRFPVMEQQEFADVVLDCDILTKKNSSSHCPFFARNEKKEGRIISQKIPSTIWRENSTSLSRKHRADLVERHGPILVCNLAALTRVVGRIGPNISRDVEKCDMQFEQLQKLRRQSNRLLRREHEHRVRDSVREQRQVARLLEVVVSPLCGGTQLRTSATPRTLQDIVEVVDRKTSPGLKKNEENEENEVLLCKMHPGIPFFW